MTSAESSTPGEVDLAAGERASPPEPAGSGAQAAPSTDPSTGPSGELERLREEIEEIDRELIRLIGRRVEVARAVGAAKRAAGLPTLDPAREAAVVRRSGELARDAGVADEEVRRVFWQLIGLSRRAQEGGEAGASRGPADAPGGPDPVGSDL